MLLSIWMLVLGNSISWVWEFLIFYWTICQVALLVLNKAHLPSFLRQKSTLKIFGIDWNTALGSLLYQQPPPHERNVNVRRYGNTVQAAIQWYVASVWGGIKPSLMPKEVIHAFKSNSLFTMWLLNWRVPLLGQLLRPQQKEFSE